MASRDLVGSRRRSSPRIALSSPGLRRCVRLLGEIVSIGSRVRLFRSLHSRREGGFRASNLQRGWSRGLGDSVVARWRSLWLWRGVKSGSHGRFLHLGFRVTEERCSRGHGLPGGMEWGGDREVRRWSRRRMNRSTRPLSAQCDMLFPPQRGNDG